MKRTTVKSPDDRDTKPRHEAARGESQAAEVTRGRSGVIWGVPRHGA